jgi:hypothetical protein
VRHVRMLGLCMVAALAVAAVAATNASALPEWGQCFEKTGGKYTDSNCTKKASTKVPGSFEWRKNTEISNHNFHGEGGTGILTSTFISCFPQRERHAGKCKEGETEEQFASSIECEKELNFGDTKGTKEVANIAIWFFGCKVFGSIPCSNTPEEGRINVEPVKGTLGYINKAKKEVGVLLEPVKKHGLFAQFSCEGGGVGVAVGVGNEKEGAAYLPEKTGGYDGIISPISPVNVMTGALTQTYTVNSADENIPSKFEGKHIELLESFLYNTSEPETNSSKWSKSGETITNVNSPNEGEVEIKA